MAREIKFRAFSEKSGMWSWEKLQGREDYPAHPITCLYSGAGWNVMQYTGLKDSTGNEIYEGDIISNGGDKMGVVWFDEKAGRYDIKIGENIESGLDEMGEQVLGHLNPCKIIGNIYENPELLK